MAKKVLSDVELRSRWAYSDSSTIEVEEGTVLTPAAKDFIREHQINVLYVAPQFQGKTMSRTPISVRSGKPQYVEAQTGHVLTEKPEEMTHLYGNRLVPKTHPRIAFRGQIDSLIAYFLLVQTEVHDPRLVAELEELLEYVRRILAAEVKEEMIGEVRLLGMDSVGIRTASHQVKESIGIDHPIPDHRMGRICVLLNLLRTKVRECELSAIRAFSTEDGNCERMDIVEGLNRLSSCVYILFCRQAAGHYTG